jgi:hypothetical protein
MAQGRKNLQLKPAGCLPARCLDGFYYFILQRVGFLTQFCFVEFDLFLTRFVAGYYPTGRLFSFQYRRAVLKAGQGKLARKGGHSS